MKLGIYLNSQHPYDRDPARCWAETLEQVRLIRKLGFDSLWGGEHHITPGFHYFPLMSMMQRLAAETEGTMNLGTNIVLLPLHNPVEMAEIGAFLDVISGGKFMLGVGLGYRPEEFQAFGVNIKQRVSRMAEGVEIIRRLWSETNVTHKGRYWQFENATIGPPPLQKPRPPILIAAQVEESLKRAAQIADGWCAVSSTTLEETAKDAAIYKKARADAGLPPAEHIVRLYEVACAPDEETALQRAAPFVLEKYAAYTSWGLLGVNLNKSDAPEAQLKQLGANRFGIGSPAHVTEALMAQHRLGINHLTMRVSWPGMKQDDILAGIELLGREVLPEVRRRVKAGG